MALNIFLGAHGTGKSTIIKEIKKRRLLPDYLCCDSIARVVKETKISYYRDLSNVFEEQKLINNLLMHQYDEFKDNNVIASRSIIDGYIYSDGMYDGNFEESTNYVLIEHLCNNIKYDTSINNIFYFPIEFSLENDGIRPNRQNQQEIDTAIRKFISDQNLLVHIISGAIEERLEKIVNIIRN